MSYSTTYKYVIYSITSVNGYTLPLDRERYLSQYYTRAAGVVLSMTPEIVNVMVFYSNSISTWNLEYAMEETLRLFGMEKKDFPYKISLRVKYSTAMSGLLKYFTDALPENAEVEWYGIIPPSARKALCLS